MFRFPLPAVLFSAEHPPAPSVGRIAASLSPPVTTIDTHTQQQLIAGALSVGLCFRLWFGSLDVSASVSAYVSCSDYIDGSLYVSASVSVSASCFCVCVFFCICVCFCFCVVRFLRVYCLVFLLSGVIGGWVVEFVL
jgi:hypothetical protein